jgi:biopolymer transport protein ExbB
MASRAWLFVPLVVVGACVLEPSGTRSAGPGAEGSGASGAAGPGAGSGAATGGGQGQGGTGAGAGGGAPEGWWDPAFRSRIQITFDNGGGEELLKFPVVVRLDAMTLGDGKIQPTGDDLRFVDDDGVTVLPHEIEQWDLTAESVVWVRVPRIDPDSTEDHIWLYYGNPDAIGNQQPEAVWDEFAGVYHFAEAGLALDSSEGGHDGAEAGTVGFDEKGQIGGALLLSGTGNLRLTGTSVFSAGANERRTVEVWFKTSDTGHQYVLSQETGCRGYGVEMGLQEDRKLLGRLFVTGQSICSGIQQYYAHTGDTGYADGDWHYAALVIDRSQQEMRLYIDGDEEDSTSVSQTLNATSGAAWIGAEYNDASRFDGSIDEVRVSTSARSAGWIDAQHRSMTGDLATLGKAEHLP